MYEALLREGMDAEQTEHFDELLEQASPLDDDALSAAEKHSLMQSWGGEAMVTD